ncbi:hypothetical protein ACFL6S_16405 [Candidatus Poribacteria bacterium]
MVNLLSIAVLTIFLCHSFAYSEPRDTDPEMNLALGKPVQYVPLPNYGLTAKEDTDSMDLTDGVLSDHPRGHLWFDSKCVGWSYAGRCNLALDLGAVYPIDEVAIRIQGGSPQAGVCTPVWMELLVSDDGHLYRLAGEYSTFREGDASSFGVPAYEGQAWVHRFRFRELKTRARYIGMRIYTAGLTVADELYVFRGDHNPNTSNMDALPATDFSVSAPQMYFHKPYLCFTTNVTTPNPIGLVMPPEAAAEEVTITMDLPRGARLIDGSLGGTELSEIEGEEVDDGDFTRYKFVANATKTTKTWGRIFIGGNWHDKQVGELRYRVERSSGETTPGVSVPLRAIEIQTTPQPGKLVAGFGWYSLQSVKSWPDGLDALRKLGINTVSSFVHWMKDDDEELWDFWDQCAERGFKRLNVDSTFHRIEKQDEIFCQFEDGEYGSRLCPSYRGTYYQKEVRRVAQQCAGAKPDYLFGDIEIWGWRGPVDAERCTRCKADFTESGLESWEEWKLQKGYEMWSDVVKSVRNAVKEVDGPAVEFGVYDWRAGKAYQFTWPFDRLYPEYLQSSQVSTYTPLYPYHIMLVGNECREDRSHLPRADVIPWITPGDAGTFSGERFRYALLECFANGARGMNFWSNRVWDAELLAAYARVIRSVAPVEDLIISGELLEGGEIKKTGRISGVVSGDEMLVLVSDYPGTGPTESSIRLPVKSKCIVTDLDTGEEMGDISADEWLTIPLHSERVRFLHVRPKVSME